MSRSSRLSLLKPLPASVELFVHSPEYGPRAKLTVVVEDPDGSAGRPVIRLIQGSARRGELLLEYDATGETLWLKNEQSRIDGVHPVAVAEIPYCIAEVGSDLEFNPDDCRFHTQLTLTFRRGTTVRRVLLFRGMDISEVTAPRLAEALGAADESVHEACMPIVLGEEWGAALRDGKETIRAFPRPLGPYQRVASDA